MAIPKKNNIKVYRKKELYERRSEMLNEITKSDPYLPDAILHDDLDKGMMEFVKEHFKIVSSGVKIPIIPKLLTIQRWAEITNTWEFSDKDNNIQIPFIAVIRDPVVNVGTNIGLINTIPNRKTFTYSVVKNWNGVRKGADIYKIPQPIPIDIKYDLVIVSTSIRDLNRLNQIIMQKFTSAQAYTVVKGHYMPIQLKTINDTSNITSIEERRFYKQSYTFNLMGFLIDPDEFEVTPAVDRYLLITEFNKTQTFQKKYINKNIDITVATFIANGTQTQFSVGESVTILFNVMVNGLIQKKDDDFYHISRTSNINFRIPPSEEDRITITYYKGRNNIFIDNYGKPINLEYSSFIYDGSSLKFKLPNIITSIVSLDINGLVEEEGVGFFISDIDEITLNFEPFIDSKIGITYLY